MSDWKTFFEGTEFYASRHTEKILDSLVSGLELEIVLSNARSINTVPTWHVFFKGIRILAVDVYQASVLCRFIKMQYAPAKLINHQGFKMENWSKGKYGNISLIDSSHALELKPFLAEHIKILDEVLSRKRSD